MRHRLSAGRPSRAARLGEPALLAGSSLLLVWLNAGERGPEPLGGVVLGPAFSFALVVAAVWLVPGYLLTRLLDVAGGGAIARLGFSFGLGIAWIAVPSAWVLLARGTIEVLAGAVTALNGLLAAAYLVARSRRGDPAEPAGRVRPASVWIAAAGLAGFAYLQGLAARRPRFSFGSDEWILMRAIRYFLEARPIAATWDFDVWDLQIALLLRFARVDLLDAYRLYLPPVLILAASAAFLALADALFANRTVSWFSYLLFVLHAASDMRPRGSGLGMGLIVRLGEDRHAAWLILLPLAQAAFLGFLRDARATRLAAAAAIALAGVVVYPMVALWLALSAGATAVAALATRRVRLGRRALLLAGAGAAAAAVLAAWLRGQRASPYFELYAPEWPFNAVLRGLSRGQLLILSLEDGSYMAHPALLAHPLTIGGVLAALALLPRFRRSLAAQFVACSTLVPLALVYNPLTAPWLGHWITPWMLHRVPWMLPSALALGCVLHDGLLRVQRRMTAAEAEPAAGRAAALWLALVALFASLLEPRTSASWRAVKARNRVGVAEGEKDLMHAIGRNGALAGRVLAPRGLSIRLPAWTSRLQPYPSLDDLRVATPDAVREWNAFYAAAAVGDAERAYLLRHGIDYVIAPAGTPVDAALRASPDAFKPLYTGPSYSLYALRKERWRADGAVTSFDTHPGNPDRATP